MPPDRSAARIAAIIVTLALLVVTAVPVGAAPTRVAVASSLTITASGPTSISLGAIANYTANASGGNPPYVYSWAVPGVPANRTGGSSVSFRPLFDGIFDLNASVRDANGSISWAILQVSVQGPSPVSVKLSAIATTPDGRVIVRAIPSGGTPPYKFEWGGPGASGNTTSSDIFTTSPLGTGRYDLSVTVTDSVGFVGLAELPIVVQQTGGGGTAWWVWGAILGLSFAGAVALAVVVLRLRRGRGGTKEVEPSA